MRKTLLVSLALVLCCALMAGASDITKTNNPSNTAAGSREMSILTPDPNPVPEASPAQSASSTAAIVPTKTPTSAITGSPVELPQALGQVNKEDPNYETNKFQNLSRADRARMGQLPYTSSPNTHSTNLPPVEPPPAIQSVYLSEGFENGGSIPTGWTDAPGGMTAWLFNGGTSGSPAPGSVHGGSYATCFDLYSLAEGIDTLKAPPLTLHGNGSYILHFWSWDNDDSSYPCYGGLDGAKVIVKYGTGSWQLLANISNNSVGWVENTLIITTSETAFQFAFVGEANWGCTNPYIDDVSFYDNSNLGRCCYGDPLDPSCEENTTTDCAALGGNWLRAGNCDENPCILPPPNDDCANAEAITGPYPVTVSGTTIGATVDCPLNLNWKAVWYSIDLPYASNNLSIDFCPSTTQPNQMGIVTMADCNSCSNLDYADDYYWRDCSNGTEQVIMSWFGLPGPATIYFPCWNDPSANFSFVCDVEQWAPLQPDFVVTGPGTFTQGNTCGAGNDCLGHHSEDQVWQITLPTDGRWTFSLCNTTPAWDTWISLGSSLCSADFGYNEDACAGGLSSITSNLQAGTYYLTVESYFPSSCGPYQLDVTWGELPPAPPNDTCSNVTPIPLSDGQTLTFEGTTFGANFDCYAFDDYPNVWIAFTTTEYMDITIDYCGTIPAFDNLWLNLAVDCDCSNFTPAGTWNRSECGDGNATLHSNGVPPGTWYYPVLNDQGADGPYVIHVTGHATVPSCVLTCPPSGIQENEPACGYNYDDTFNAGCTSIPPSFSPYEFGQVACGQSGTFPALGGWGRDTDWYQVSLTEPREIHLNGVAEFPMQLAIYDGNNGCPEDGPALLAWTANYYSSCDTFGVNTGIVQPGTYWLFASPANWYGVPCGFNYQMWATADSVAPPPPNDECSQVTPALLAAGDTLTFNGDNSGATMDCPMIGGYRVAWEAFTIDRDQPILIDYCGTDNFSMFAYAIVVGCPCDTFIMNDGWDRSCDGTRVKFWFENLAAGTYYIPVYTDPNNSGPYTIHVYENVPVPPPDYCANSNYSQDADWEMGLIDCLGDITDGWIVDDFTTASSIVLDSLFVRESNRYFVASGDAQLLIMNSVGGLPGDTVFLGTLPAIIRSCDRIFYGDSVYWYGVNPGLTLTAGTYFVGLRAIGVGEAAYVVTAPVTGTELYFQSNYYHVPNFIPSSTPISQGGFGVAYDMAYCVFTHESAGGCQYVIGDINGNGTTNGIDVGYGVNYFKGGPTPPIQCDICPQPSPFFAGGDVNGNCVFNGIDITFFVNYLKGIVPSLLYCPTCPPAAPIPAVSPSKTPLLEIRNVISTGN